MKKFISICEVSDYIWNSLVYIAKDSSADNNELEKKLGKSGALVSKLTQDFHGKSYHLCVDNWYTNEKLFDHLERNGTVACGTARLNRLKVPSSLKRQEMKKDDHTFR